jgi:hypothetical protein
MQLWSILKIQSSMIVSLESHPFANNAEGWGVLAVPMATQFLGRNTISNASMMLRPFL